MNQHRPVPRLDLAPKLKRPLSLWNPLDYLRLLYWVFFFPQALRWYVDTFGGGYIPPREMDERKGWELLRQNAIQRQLLLQGLMLTVVTPLSVGVLLERIDIRLDWAVMALGVWGGVALGVWVAVKWSSVAWGVTSGVTLVAMLVAAWGVASVAVWGAALVLNLVTPVVEWGVWRGVSVGVWMGVWMGVALGVWMGVWMGVCWGVGLGMGGVGVDPKISVVGGGVGLGVWGFILLGVLLGVASVVGFVVEGGVVLDMRFVVTVVAFVVGFVVWFVVAVVVFVVVFIVALGVAVLRLESWLIGSPLKLGSFQNGSWLLPHITPLPLPYLAFRLQNWLQQDWETSLHNTNQLLAYTLQFIPVVQAVNQALAITPSEQIIWRVSRLAEAPYDWQLVRFASASLNAKLKSETIEGFFVFLSYSYRWQERLQARFETDTRLDTPARAAAAGFWHLHEKKAAKAMEAFAVVRSLLYGDELFVLAQTLATFHDAKYPSTIAALQVPAFPKEALLRPATWRVIASLHQIVKHVQIFQSSVSSSARARNFSRALRQLKDILNNAETVPQAERGLIVDIAQTWQKTLLKVADEVVEIPITKPVINPYVVGDPIQGNLLVGREDVLRQLEEFWVMGHQLQSIVLYGHRRMGKTSILRNVANCLEAEVKIAYINLLNMGATSQGVGEVLMAISDAISDSVGCTPPTDADLLNLPYRTFERYLKQVEALLSGGLIVALDEFEKIEELIEAEKIPKDFMGYLRGLVQMSSKVAFAFAGLHTLEEMTADYFQPFFASVIPIHVGFLQPGATRQILANPDEDFPLDYTPDALDQIYALTAGQPYLVQLVGFQLVRRYNDYVFEQGRSRNPVFTVEDVEAVINDPEFFKRGRYYFDGVWGQAARGASGQQAILIALAPYPEGLSLDRLRTRLDEILEVQGCALLQEETLQESLKTLKRHDVVQEFEGSWHIIVELFRRWVLQA